MEALESPAGRLPDLGDGSFIVREPQEAVQGRPASDSGQGGQTTALPRQGPEMSRFSATGVLIRLGSLPDQPSAAIVVPPR
jgi:hypothetical protein